MFRALCYIGQRNGHTTLEVQRRWLTVVVGRTKPSAWPSRTGLSFVEQSNQEFCVLNPPLVSSKLSFTFPSNRRNQGFSAFLSPDGPSWKTWLTTGSRAAVLVCRFRLPLSWDTVECSSPRLPANPVSSASATLPCAPPSGAAFLKAAPGTAPEMEQTMGIRRTITQRKLYNVPLRLRRSFDGGE